MIEASSHRPAVSRRTRVHADDIRRSVRTQAAGWRETLASGATVRNAMFFVAAYPFFGFLPFLRMPAFLYFLLVPAACVYFLWFSRLKRRLPFRAPADWPGLDYSLPKPGRPGQYRDADGLVHLGYDQETRGELTITNSDARRHMFVLGTTGSGKALPVQAKILTPAGFTAIGEIRSGDLAKRPDGRDARIIGVYPQGRRPLIRLGFQDGRFVDCDRDHLWKVRITPDATAADADGWRLMTAADIGIFVSLYPERAVSIPLVAAHDFAFAGKAFAFTANDPPDEDGWTVCRARSGVDRLEAETEALQARKRVWSAGGLALAFADLSGRPALRWRFPAREGSPAREDADLIIVSATPVTRSMPNPPAWAHDGGLDENDEAECVCVRLEEDRDPPAGAPASDGLFVTDNWIVTHNTEFLLGVCSQPLMWSSGFLFVDGKGTPQFYGRVFSVCKRFGRQDDLRVINFMGAEDSDLPSGGPKSQTNTLNPFARGTADQLTNMLISLMGDSGSSGDMWKGRAAQLISSAMRVLVELRDNGDLLLDVQAIRDFLPLGKGIDRPGQQPPPRGQRGQPKQPSSDMAAVTDLEWEELRTRPGMIELYLRSLHGEFSSGSSLALKGFFDSLPGFVLDKAWAGTEQDAKTLEQYGYLSMQLTKPLGSLADDFGHIFRTPLGEVDMNDIVFQRRILIVLLPALQKAPDEIKNCGKIIVAMLKQMMGVASGDKIDGPRLRIIDSSATKSATPFIAVLDEIGYYMVDGVDIMMAQARSLNFCLAPAGQDLQAMKKGGSTVADSVAANARLTVIGATEDAAQTRQFVMDKIGRGYVAASTGFNSQTNLVGGQYADQMAVSFQEAELVTLQELQGLKEGEFYILFEGVVCRASTFYIGEEYAKFFRVNKFLKVRAPTDRAPGYDQKEEIEFDNAWRAVVERMASPVESEIDPRFAGADEETSDDPVLLTRQAFEHPEPDSVAGDRAGDQQSPIKPSQRWRALAVRLCAFLLVDAPDAGTEVDEDAFDAIIAAEQAVHSRELMGTAEARRLAETEWLRNRDDQGEGEGEGEGEGGGSGGGPSLTPGAFSASGKDFPSLTPSGKPARDASPDEDKDAPSSLDPTVVARGEGGSSISKSLFAAAISPRVFAPGEKIDLGAFVAPAARPAAAAPPAPAPTPAPAPAAANPSLPPASTESSDLSSALAGDVGQEDVAAPALSPEPERPTPPSPFGPGALGRRPGAPTPAGSGTKPAARSESWVADHPRRETLPAEAADGASIADFLSNIVDEALKQDGRSGADDPRAQALYRRKRKSEALRRMDALLRDRLDVAPSDFR